MGITYKDSGVDIEAGAALVDKIKQRVSSTFNAEVLTEIGGFGGLYQPKIEGLKQPVLVSGCDGVGTKLRIAYEAAIHDTVGIDLVAMSVNDVLTSGARPLFFLDYLSCGKLSTIAADQIIEGIVQGCESAGCALLGGETAEMPGSYPDGEYDLAGFCVGLVERDKIINGNRIKAGDRLIGLASSGLHSNGFSLVRHLLFNKNDYSLTSPAPWDETRTLADSLLTPTRIYVKPVLKILEQYQPKGLVHITGGGLLENLPRILPEGMGVEVVRGSWDIPALFTFLAELGELTEAEQHRTFNMGLGLVIVVDAMELDLIMAAAKQAGETAWVVGTVVESAAKEVRFV